MGKIITQVAVEQPALMVSKSPVAQCWRMVYRKADKFVLYLHESAGLLTINGDETLFVSSLTDGSQGSVSSAEGLQECVEQINGAGLTFRLVPANVEQMLQQQAAKAAEEARQRGPSLVPRALPKVKGRKR